MDISISIPDLMTAGLAMSNKHISTDISSTITAGLTLSNRLFDLAGKAGGAGTEPNQTAVEITLLTAILQQVSSTIINSARGNGTAGRYSIGAIAIMQKILDRCQLMYDELNTMLNRIDVDIRNSLNVVKGRGTPSANLEARVKCEFDKVEIRAARAMMEACKITLCLMGHNLAMAGRKMVSRRRHSSFHGANPEEIQSDLLSQTLQLARRTTIANLERLENAEQASSTKRPTGNRLRKLQRKPKPMKRGEIGSLEEKKEEEKEKPSEWVRSLVRLEINNELIILEFSPRMRGVDGDMDVSEEGGNGFSDGYGDKVIVGCTKIGGDIAVESRAENITGDRQRRASAITFGPSGVGIGKEVRASSVRAMRGGLDGHGSSDRESKVEEPNAKANAKAKAIIGLGELPGDGPEDLAGRSERMEYSRGWPMVWK